MMTESSYHNYLLRKWRLLCEMSFYASSLVLVCRGVNLVPFLEYVGFPDKVVKLLENSQSGYALTAYAMYKVG